MTYSSETLAQLMKIASLSKKENTKVGAILLDQDKRILFEASNDYIYPVYENTDIELESDKHFYSEHAERRLIYSAIRSGFSDFKNTTLVVTHFPCCDCSRAIILVGIKTVAVLANYMSLDFINKWENNMAVSRRMLEFNSVNVLIV